MTMLKLTKTQVIKHVKEAGNLVVELYPSNCSPQNQTWVQGISIELFYENGEIVQRSFDDEGTFESAINSFSYYNCNNELGKRVHFYIEIA